MAIARRRALAIVVVAAAGAALLLAPASRAQDNPLTDALTTTTTVKPVASSTTSTTSPPTGDQLRSGSGSAPAGVKDVAGGDGATTPAGGMVVPPGAQRIIDSVRRTPPNDDAALVSAVHGLVDMGMTQDEAYRIGMGRFPVAGLAHFTDDWLTPRFGPGFRFHLGCDVFADAGTPLRAPVDGVATTAEEALGGLTVRVTMPDNTYFYLAHLSGLVAGFTNGMAVKTGDIVGYVGTSGNAKGGAAHVHVGVYPLGGAPVDPKPVLDKFVADATALLPRIVAAYQAAHPAAGAPVTETAEQRLLRPTLATALLHPLAAGGDGLTPVALYLLANDPIGGGRQLLQGQLDDLAATATWTEP